MPGVMRPAPESAEGEPDADRASLADDALFRPVRAGNAFEDTVARLLQAIRLGLVAPGESLPPERDLAARLAVSRDTVRDAIGSLANAGFLVARRGRYGGTFVTEAPPAHADLPPVSAAEIDDILRLRDILEPGAARTAACQSLDVEARHALRARLAETSAASVDEYRRLDSRLHLTIAELAATPSLVPLIADNRMHVNDLLDRIPLLHRNIAHSNQQHERIVDAILTADGDRADAAVREHLDGSSALIRGFLA